MEYLCQTCDEYIYDEYSINNPNLNDIDKIFNNYVTSYNKKLDINYIKCDFYLVFNNDFGIHIKTHYVHNKDDLTKIKTELLFKLELLKYEGYRFCYINEMIIKTITDKHWMTYTTYMQKPMPMVERRFNNVVQNCPYLIRALDRNKYSHIEL